MDKQRFSTSVLFVVLIFVLLSGVGWQAIGKAAPLSASLDVPFFSQTALRTQTVSNGRVPTLGNSDLPLWEYGCGVASLAMVFRQYGVDTNVARLNDTLRTSGAFVGGLLAWDKTDAFLQAGAPWVKGIERINTARPQEYQARIDTALDNGEPILAYLNDQHYVVITGKEGDSYRINDPWAVTAETGKSIALDKNLLAKGGFDSIRQLVFVSRQEYAPTNGVLVQGTIRDRYVASRGAQGPLGNPSQPQEPLTGGGVWQRFERGAIFAPANAKPTQLFGPLWDKFQAAGGIAELGLPRSDIYSYFVGPAVEWRADFANASILWTEGERPDRARTIDAANGVKAEYFANPNLSGQPAYSRYEGDLLFDWRDGAPGPWVGVDNFSARYTQTFQVGGLGWRYNFLIDTDSGVQVTLDGKLIVDAWDQPGQTHKFNHNLWRGKHELVVEYRHTSDAAHLRFARSDWPATPVFAAEDTAGSFETLPVSAAEYVHDLPAAIAAVTPWATPTPAVAIPFMGVQMGGGQPLTTATNTPTATQAPAEDERVLTVGTSAFEQWAKNNGEPYRDVQINVADNDGFFAHLRVVAWFRPTASALWEDREAAAECRQVGGAWQCDTEFVFALTQAEQARHTTASPDVVARLAANPLHPRWTSYTNYNYVADILVQGDILWAATVGGLVQWDTRTGNSIKLTTEHGLASNFVTSLAVATDGSLWIGTQFSGLSRLTSDGRWTTFTTDDGLVDNSVSSLAVAADGSVWVGTQFNGLSRLAPDGRWATFTTDDGLVDNWVTSLAVAADGSLWAGTRGGLSHLSPDGHWTTFTTNDGLVDNWVTSLAVAADGTLWVGTKGGGLSYLAPHGRLTTITTIPGLAYNDILSLAVATDGSLWAGAYGAMSHLSSNGQWSTFTAEHGLGSNRITSLAVVADGSVWVGTDDGLSRLSLDGRWTTFTTDYGLAGNIIDTLAMAVAADGSLWVGTWGGGLSRLFPNGRWTTFTTDDGLADNYVTSLAVATDGTLWVGTKYRGIGRLSSDGRWTTFTTDDGLVDNSVSSLAVAADGTLWVGTKGGGLSRLTSDGRWATLTTDDGLVDNWVTSLAVAADGTRWAATYRGLSRLSSDGRWTTFTTNDGLVDNQVTYLAVDADCTLWAGTDDGLSRLSPDGHWTTFTTNDGLVDNRVTSLAVAADGTLWVGTKGRGLSRLTSDGRWATFTTDDGLVDNWVTSLAVAADGTLWAGTLGNLSRYKP
ncbi:MAG: two-component regulator propeller domain-containing protein [Caldilineaceae bacterium]